jgi:hypothetical protein
MLGNLLWRALTFTKAVCYISQHKITSLYTFHLFNSNNWFSYRFNFLVSLYCCGIVVSVWRYGIYCLSEALFDFSSCCDIHSVHIERSTSTNYKFNQWFVHQHIRDPKIWTFQSRLFNHIICRYFIVVYY